MNVEILTAGGDSPGLYAAIRAIGKAAIRSHGMQVVGFRDGFRGLMQNRLVRLDGAGLSGILTMGGTILGHVQRGGTPAAVDRLLATKLGADAVEFIAQGQTGIMVGTRGDETAAVPLEEVAGQRRGVPLDHRWIRPARSLGVPFGVES